MAGISGCSGQKTVGELTREPVAEAPVDPQEKLVPKEAEDWVIAYGPRYDDPVSTYYAARALESVYGNKGLVISDEFFADYNLAAQKNQVSPIGFEWYTLPSAEKRSHEDVIKIFNEYVAKELSLYMNALAKNPTTEAEQIIDFEFTNWCSDAMNLDNNPVPTKDEEYIANLMSTCKEVVAKYGSSANYSVNKVTSVKGDGGSYIDPYSNVMIFEVDENGKILTFSNSLDMVIEIDIYNNDTLIMETLSISDIQLTYTRQPNGMMSIGQMVK